MRLLRSIALFLALGLLLSGCLENDSPRVTDDAAMADAFVDAGSVPASNGVSIGAAGGVVAIDGVLLRIPEGALDTEVELRIEVLESISAGHRLQSPIFQFSPAGLTFLRPVVVEMSFAGSGDWARLFWSKADGLGYEALDTEIRANVAVAELTPGLYVVHVVGEAFSFTRRFVVVR